MKKVLLWILFLLLSDLSIIAQQNFFNVPSSNITEKNRIFLQQQLNVFSQMMASNTTFCFGLGKKYEVGFNILGVTYDNDEKKIISNPIDEQPVYPSLSINMQKLILENKHYSLAMGGQLAFPAVPSEFEYYIYLNNKFELKKTVLVAGLYYGNDTYFGNETRFSNLVQDIGIQLGLEFEIVKNRWYFQADCFSGQTPISNVIIGGAYKFTKHLILSAGFQRPNTKRTSANGLVLELTYIQ